MKSKKPINIEFWGTLIAGLLILAIAVGIDACMLAIKGWAWRAFE